MWHYFYSHTNCYARDEMMNIQSRGYETDSNELYVLMKIVETPFSPLETSLLNFVQRKYKMEVFKSTQSKPCKPIYNSCKFNLQINNVFLVIK